MSQIAALVNEYDARLFGLINGYLRTQVLDRLFSVITHLGGAVFTILWCIIAAGLGAGYFRTAAICAGAALAGSHLCVQAVKWLCRRRRPYLALPHVRVITRPLRDMSFPSGHSTAIAAVTTVYALYFPAAAWPLEALALLVGYSRIYVGLHYPSDVGAGLFLGSACAYLTVLGGGMW